MSQGRHTAPLPPGWPKIRKWVLRLDGHRCRLRGPRCTGQADEIEHIDDPGDHSLGNLRAVCSTCHASRQADAARTVTDDDHLNVIPGLVG